MKISRTQLAAVIAQRSLETVNVQTLSREIAAYLLSEGRTNELDSVLRDVMQYRADHGIVEVITVVAYPLADTVRADIESVARELYPAAKQIIISQERDETVIGGARIEFANEQLDLSVRAKLNRFKQLTTATGDMP